MIAIGAGYSVIWGYFARRLTLSLLLQDWNCHIAQLLYTTIKCCPIASLYVVGAEAWKWQFGRGDRPEATGPPESHVEILQSYFYVSQPFDNSDVRLHQCLHFIVIRLFIKRVQCWHTESFCKRLSDCEDKNKWKNLKTNICIKRFPWV